MSPRPGGYIPRKTPPLRQKMHLPVASAVLGTLPKLAAAALTRATRCAGERRAVAVAADVAQTYELVEHSVACLLDEVVDVGGGLAPCADGREDADVDDTGVEFALLHVEDVTVVRNDDGDDGDFSLDGEVEGTLFEGKELGLFGVGAGAFGEDEDVLALGAHGLGG